VGRGGVEPPQSQTADLQSVGLATCSASPHCLIILYHDLGVFYKNGGFYLEELGQGCRIIWQGFY